MTASLIMTYWQAKTARIDVTKALYRSVAELDNQPLIDTFSKRVNSATTAMLAIASDMTFPDVSSVNLTLISVIFGTVRNVFEQDLTPSNADRVIRQLITMCNACLDTFRTG
ncbi:hypothetical protein QMZ93_02535 [Pantoea stewartii subsp. indologenes]|uniref:hypothetical protein n=1 Tax=Pantoea stewartii TaxID=66269 RepID=UPI00197EDC64|nr:hypothetical protein [Pantoea stewartii]MDK2632226.1 hypothetical protein [Pantoea stewartii subsp. indologenes]